MPSNPILALVVAASLGALIGLVRQWSYEREHRGQTAKAGLRTFTAWAVLGCSAGLLEQNGAQWALAASLATFTIILGVVHFSDRRHKSLGLTTLSVGLVTFTAGALAAYNQHVIAIAMGVGAMLIIGSKQWSHAWTKRWNEADLRVLLQFAAITGLILPLAPNQDYGPYGVFNPFKIWLMVVFVASLGFLGYVAIRFLGARAGLMVTGLAGGLASSTATTLAMSRKSKEVPALDLGLALAVVLSCTVMLARVAVVMAVIDRKVFLALLPIFCAMALPGAIWALWQWLSPKYRNSQKVDTPQLTNPLSLSLAIKFALLYAIIRLAVKATAENLPDGWLYVVSFVSGLTDMDAIAISSTQAAANSVMTVDVAARCVLIAALSNTLVKAGLAVALGTPGFRKAIVFALGSVFAVGVAGWWFI